MPFGASTITAGKAAVRIYLDSDEYVKGLKSAETKLKAFGSQMQAFGAVAAAGSAAVLGPMLVATRGYASYGDQLDKMSRRTGVSVESLSELGYAAGQSGASLEDLGGVLAKMNRRLGRLTAGEGTASQVDAIRELGLSIEQLQGLNAEGRFLAIADAMQKYGDQAAAAGLAQRAFGTGVDSLLPLINEGVDGIERLRQKARDLGLTVSATDAARAAELTDALDDFAKVAQTISLSVGSALAGDMTELTQRFVEAGQAVRETIERNRELLVLLAKIAATVGGVGAGFIAVGTAINVAGVAAGTLATALKALTASMTLVAAHPVGAAVVALGVVVAATSVKFADLRREMGDTLSAQDRARATDLDRIDSLQKLADKEALNSSEMKLARTFISQLTAKYGDLGLTINETTGAIEGMADAQARANDRMRDAAGDELKAAILENMRNQTELRKQYDSTWEHAKRFWFGERDFLPQFTPGGIFGVYDDPIMPQLSVLERELEGLTKRYQELTGGDISALTGPDAAGAGPSTADQVVAGTLSVDQAKQIREQMIRDLADLQIAAIEDAHQREIASINAKYDLEQKRLDELKASRDEWTAGELQDFQEAADAIQAARDQAIGNADDQARQKKEEEAGRRDEQAAASRQRLQDEIARLKIETNTPEGLERQKELLELQRDIELRGADAAGVDPTLIRQKYSLELARLNMEAASQSMHDMPSISTFSAEKAFRLGMGKRDTAAEKTAKATEETAANTNMLALEASEMRKLIERMQGMV